MAFRKKAAAVLALKPDILIVPECEHTDKLIFSKDLPVPSNIIWYGTNQNKGLAIFSFGTYKLRLLDIHNPEIRMVLPIAVTGGPKDFTLFAIWAYNPIDPSYKYIGQVWKGIVYYEKILKGGNVILAGDFNSNTIWDKLKRRISHTRVVDKLESIDILSAYHMHSKLKQGGEEHPTYFMYRHLHRPYHIDYCFASKDFIDVLENVEVGTHETWATLSDHNPLIVSFDLRDMEANEDSSSP